MLYKNENTQKDSDYEQVVSDWEESGFLMKIAGVVTQYQTNLEKVPPSYFVEAWKIRCHEVTSLETAICEARLNKTDEALFQLCTKIAEQRNIYPFPFNWFSRNDFPKAISKVLEDVKQKKITICLSKNSSPKHATKSHPRNVSRYGDSPNLIERLQVYSNSLEDEIENKEGKLRQVDTQLKQAERKYHEVEKETKQLEEKNNRMEKIAQCVREKLECSPVAMQIVQLQEEVEEVKKERDQYKERLEASEKELDLKTAQCIEKDKEVQIFRGRVAGLNKIYIDGINETKQRILLGAAKLTQAEKRVNDQNITLSERQERILRLEDENQRMTLQVAQLEKDLQKEREKNINLNSQLESEIRKMKLELAKKDQELLELKAERSLQHKFPQQHSQQLPHKKPEFTAVQVANNADSGYSPHYFRQSPPTLSPPVIPQSTATNIRAHVT